MPSAKVHKGDTKITPEGIPSEKDLNKKYFFVYFAPLKSVKEKSG